jgi:hypothetical protein
VPLDSRVSAGSSPAGAVEGSGVWQTPHLTSSGEVVAPQWPHCMFWDADYGMDVRARMADVEASRGAPRAPPTIPVDPNSARGSKIE